MTKRHGALRCRFVLWAIALPGTIVNLAAPVQAQTHRTRPTVTVSMYYAREVDVCPPDGYGLSCEPMTYPRFRDLTSRIPAVQNNIPPEELKLGVRLLNQIDSYRTVCSLSKPCSDAADRDSIILLFTVDTSALATQEDREISIVRKVRDDIRIEERPRKSGTLEEGGHWIHHERADAFLPAYDVSWVLTIGPWTWNLGTVP